MSCSQVEFLGSPARLTTCRFATSGVSWVGFKLAPYAESGRPQRPLQVVAGGITQQGSLHTRLVSKDCMICGSAHPHSKILCSYRSPGGNQSSFIQGVLTMRCSGRLLALGQWAARARPWQDRGNKRPVAWVQPVAQPQSCPLHGLLRRFLLMLCLLLFPFTVVSGGASQRSNS